MIYEGGFSGIWGLCMISTAGYNQAHRASSAFQFDHRDVQHCDTRFLSQQLDDFMGLTQFTVMKRWGSMGKYGEVWGSMGNMMAHLIYLNIHLMNQRFFFVLFWLSSLTIPEDLSHCCWDSGETTWSLIMQWSVHLHLSIWIPFDQCSIGCQTYQSYSAMVDFNCLSKQGLASGYMSEIWRHPDLATFRGLDAKQSCLFRFVPLARHLHSLRYDTRGCIRTSCDMLPNKSSCDWEIETNLGFWMYFNEKVDCCWPESSNIELNFGFHCCHVFSHFILTWCSHLLDSFLCWGQGFSLQILKGKMANFHVQSLESVRLTRLTALLRQKSQEVTLLTTYRPHRTNIQRILQSGGTRTLILANKYSLCCFQANFFGRSRFPMQHSQGSNAGRLQYPRLLWKLSGSYCLRGETRDIRVEQQSDEIEELHDFFGHFLKFQGTRSVKLCSINRFEVQDQPFWSSSTQSTIFSARCRNVWSWQEALSDCPEERCASCSPELSHGQTDRYRQPIRNIHSNTFKTYCVYT